MDMAMVGCLPASLHQYQTVSASFIWMQEGFFMNMFIRTKQHKKRKKRTAQKQQCTA